MLSLIVRYLSVLSSTRQHMDMVVYHFSDLKIYINPSHQWSDLDVHVAARVVSSSCAGCPMLIKSPPDTIPMATYLSYLRLPFALTTSLAASLSGILYWKQNDLIYPRNVPLDSRTEVPRPAGFPEYEFDDSSEELFITTPDGEKLSAFLLKPKWRKDLDYDSHKTTVMMFHGNAGNIGHRIPVAGCLQLAVPCNIFMLEYRGYGLSTGTPHEKGINVDAQTALDYLRQRKDLAGGNIVLYGQSLGGAVAVQLASQNLHVGDIKAIILENTFTSMRKLIPTFV